jgi:DNA (cytosine-5)-methyltransferase 1
MADGSIPAAPICTDVTRMDGYAFRGKVDIVIAGFPCQDISVAGKGAGLEGERSGLFFEVVRLAKEIQPTFLFLENVPAIRTRGLDTVIQELTEAGYDCRWTMLSAADVGAPHKRERWFLLANSLCDGFSSSQIGQSIESSNDRDSPRADWSAFFERRQEALWSEQPTDSKHRHNNWAVEPNVGRVVNGVPQRVDRLKRLGNAVVPLQAKTAFEILMGLEVSDV